MELTCKIIGTEVSVVEGKKSPTKLYLVKTFRPLKPARTIRISYRDIEQLHNRLQASNDPDQQLPVDRQQIPTRRRQHKRTRIARRESRKLPLLPPAYIFESERKFSQRHPITVLEEYLQQLMTVENIMDQEHFCAFFFPKNDYDDSHRNDFNNANNIENNEMKNKNHLKSKKNSIHHQETSYYDENDSRILDLILQKEQRDHFITMSERYQRKQLNQERKLILSTVISSPKIMSSISSYRKTKTIHSSPLLREIERKKNQMEEKNRTLSNSSTEPDGITPTTSRSNSRHSCLSNEGSEDGTEANSPRSNYFGESFHGDHYSSTNSTNHSNHFDQINHQIDTMDNVSDFDSDESSSFSVFSDADSPRSSTDGDASLFVSPSSSSPSPTPTPSSPVSPSSSASSSSSSSSSTMRRKLSHNNNNNNNNNLSNRSKQRKMTPPMFLHKMSIEQRRLNMVRVIVENESQYLSILRMINDEFIDPIIKKAFLPRQTFRKVFGDIEVIRSVHEGLYRELDKLLQRLTKQERKISTTESNRGEGEDVDLIRKNNNQNNNNHLKKGSSLGNVFHKKASLLKMYLSYVDVYFVGIDILQEHMKSNKRFGQFIKSQNQKLSQIANEKNQQQKEESSRKSNSNSNSNNNTSFLASTFVSKLFQHPTDLQSALRVPLLQLTRYTELLHMTLRTMPESHYDYKPTSKALSEIASIESRVTHHRETLESIQQVAEIEKRLGMRHLATPGRRYVKSSETLLKVKLNEKGTVPCKLFLFSDLLLCVKDSNLRTRRISLPLNDDDLDISVDELKPTPVYKYAFTISSKQYTFKFECANDVERQEWMDAILSCLGR